MRVKIDVVSEADHTGEASSVCGRKRCGDKIHLCFNQHKKARTPSFDFVSLENGQGSVLSVVNTVPTCSI